jgi:hypothetical protein
MQYLAAFLSFAATLVAVVAGAGDGGLPATSWLALAIAVGSLAASVDLARRAQRELKELRERERILRESAYREVQAGVSQLRRVLDYAYFATGLDETGRPVKPPPPALDVPPAGRTLEDLAAPAVVMELAALRLTPRRSIGGPWANPVPFGTDTRTLDRLIADESAAALERLELVVTQFIAVMDAGLVEDISRLCGGPFAAHLRALPSLVDRRIQIEDSVRAAVGLVNSYSGTDADYREFVGGLIEIAAQSSRTATAPAGPLAQHVLGTQQTTAQGGA